MYVMATKKTTKTAAKKSTKTTKKANQPTKSVNKIEVYNRIRALQGVVVVTVEQNQFLRSKSDEKTEYSLLHLKYIVSKDPVEAINSIKMDALSTSRVPGLLQFIPRIKTIQKKGSY